MALTKLQCVGITLVYLFLCYAHLFIWSSKTLDLLVYSPLLFTNFVVLFIITEMAVDLYRANAPYAKIV